MSKGIKSLFGKGSNKIVTNEQSEQLPNEVESEELVAEVKKTNERFLPRVDFTDPKNFARYGSAEQYYEDAISHIYKTFPYDGSEAEKSEWHREASYLDNWFFDTQYPRTTGYVRLNSSVTPHSTVTVGGQGVYATFFSPQYISLKGGPHKDPNASGIPGKNEMAKQFPAQGGNANIWESNNKKTSNLEFDPTNGNTVEFWLKYDDANIVNTASTNRAHVLFDMWNGQAIGTAGYVRFMVERLPQTAGDFQVTYLHGTDGCTRLGLSLTAASSALPENAWQHVAITVKNSGSQILAQLYYNGVFEAQAIGGADITTANVPPESLQARINGYLTPPLAGGAYSGLTSGTGGAEGIYFDEFRFWKKARTEKSIGRNWFTQLAGGTNTDINKYSGSADPVDLGVYYKFNEGIVDTVEVNALDANVVDYSGRLSNGTISNYTVGIRSTGSAMDEASQVDSDDPEYKDPILYSSHPSVSNLMSTMKLSGSTHDMTNNSAFYHTMPNWITEEDRENGRHAIKEMVQALSSYFDTLHLQIEALPHLKETYYSTMDSGLDKPYNFVSHLVRSLGMEAPDLFVEATALEEVMSRGEQEIFDLKIQEIKNIIYQNIYNNLPYIYKSKGTEKAFRNLIRCFGVDEELIKLNLYADNVDYTLKDKKRFTAIKKNFVDFNDNDRNEGIVYSSEIDGTVIGTTADTTNTKTFVAGTNANQAALLSTTFEAEVIFPKKLDLNHPLYQRPDFFRSSLFGCRRANSAAAPGVGQYLLQSPDYGSFQVHAQKPDPDSKDAKFICHFGGDLSGITLESNTYKEVYDNTKWNFAIRLTPVKNDVGDKTFNDGGFDQVDIDYTTDYVLEFYGIQTSVDVVEHEFKLTKTITPEQAANFISAPKRFHVGGNRLNPHTSGTSDKTDVKISSVRYWFDYLTDDEIKLHAFDATNAGRLHPTDDAYSFFSMLSDGTTTDIRVPRKDTLALHWDFSNVQSSDTNGAFFVDDISGGSNDYVTAARYGWFTALVGYRHTAKGNYFPASSNQVVNREYQYTAKQKLPEILNSDDMVDIRVQDDDTFGKDARPINHFFAVEKSMYQVISDEMINLFASIVEFNDLIGQPVNRYRLDYKMLGKLRSLFYENVENVPSLEKYVEFYKWLDSSLGYMIMELFPASANHSDSMRTMIESHVLERNKYWTKFPTLEMKQEPPEGQLLGIREMLYDWEHGHAPIMAPATATIVVADSGGIINGETFTLVDSAGLSTVYTINGGIAPAAGGGSGGTANVGYQGIGGGAAGKIAAAASMVIAINATTDANYTAVSNGVDTVTITQGGAGLAGNRTNNDSISSTTVSNFTGGTGSDTPDNCLWWGERTERTWDGFDTSAEVDVDREKIRKIAIRDVKGPTKKVGNDPDRHIIDLWDKTTSTIYEGSTYAVRRLSRPYRLRVEEQETIKGGQNIPHATQSPNQVIRAATPIRAGASAGVEITAYVDDPANCKDEFKIDQGGPNTKTRRAFKVALKDALGIETPLKGSLVLPATYADFPNDTSPAVASAVYHSDTYGEDNEVPMQGPFTSQWVGGNQHRHVTLSTEFATEALATRPELYLRTGSPVLYQHPHDINSTYPIARWMRGETAKRPVNIENIKTIAGRRDRDSANQVPLGNYTHDYEIVQTSGRSQNNRWLTKRFADSSVLTYVNFDGTDDYLRAGATATDGSAYKFAVTDSFSWSLWFKRGRNGTIENLVTKLSSGTGKGYEIIITSGNKIQLRLQQDGAKRMTVTSTGTSLNDTSWHHLVVTYDGTAVVGGVKIYVDGVPQSLGGAGATGTWPGTSSNIVEATTPLHFGIKTDGFSGGSWSFDEPFQGGLDEVSVFERVLAVAEVKDLRKKGRHALLNTISPHLQPSSWWRMGHSPVPTMVLDEMNPTDAAYGVGLFGATWATDTLYNNWDGGNINKLPFQIANGNESYRSPWITNTAHGSGGGTTYYLYDFTLPDRSVNGTRRFGTSDHIFVERFSAPGSPAVSARGALDAEAEEFSPYNSLNWRNLLVRNHLNFWHTDHSRWGGYRDDYIHGLPGDSVGPEDGTTPGVASWHKVNRNAINKMYLKGADNPANHAASYGWERDYDNFFVSHQIPRSDWQYHWINASALEASVQLPNISGVNKNNTATFTFASAHGLQVGDLIYIGKVTAGMVGLNDLPQPFKVLAGGFGANTATLADASGVTVDTLHTPAWSDWTGTASAFYFPLEDDSEKITSTRLESAVASVHPRHFGFTSSFPNANTSTNSILSGSYQYMSAGTTYSQDVDFVYGNTLVVEPVDFVNNVIGLSCNTRCGPNMTTANLFASSRLFKFVDMFKEDYKQANTTPAGSAPLSRHWVQNINMPPFLRETEQNHRLDECPTLNINRDYLNGVTWKQPQTSELNALLLNRNGPYQCPSWKMIRHYENPIVRGQRYNNIITVQDIPKVREIKIPTRAEAAWGSIEVVTAPTASDVFTITFVSPIDGVSTVVSVTTPSTSDATARKYDTAEAIFNAINTKIEDGTLKLKAYITAGSRTVVISAPQVGSEYNGASHQIAGAAGASFTVRTATGSYETANDPTGRLSGGTSPSFKIQSLRDRRSDSHIAYREPPIAWNRPMRHTVALGATGAVQLQHTYSNNIECFANPKLTARLGVVRCTENQIYNRLLEKYSPVIADKVQLDFVEIKYKEYVFPKHRHVGLLKVRRRMRYGQSPDAWKDSRTGALRIFWRDDKLLRIKKRSSFNAVGFAFDLKDHAHFKQNDSIHAMDDFYQTIQQTHGNYAVKEDTWKVLGDLAYVGIKRYNSWITHRQCSWSYSKYAVKDTSPIQYIDPPSDDHDISHDYLSRTHTFDGTKTGGRGGYTYNADRPIKPGDPPHSRLSYDDSRWGKSSGSTDYSATLKRVNGYSDNTNVVDSEWSASESEAVGLVQGSINPQSPAASISPFNLPLSNLHLIYPRLEILEANPACKPPRPAIQFYYNPYNSEWCEDGWKYKTNELTGRNPWYDSYKDYNLDIRTIGQNYGLLAEYRISQHMKKHVQNDGGNFRSKNFNFLSLDGASYDTFRHTGNTHTQFSGKTKITTKKVFSRTGAGLNIIKSYPTLADLAALQEATLVDDTIPPLFDAAKAYTNADLATALSAVSNKAWWVATKETTFLPSETTYVGKNPILAGGSLTIENSVMTEFDIGGSFPNQRTPSWNTTDEDDGTGRLCPAEPMIAKIACQVTGWTNVEPPVSGTTAGVKVNVGREDEYLIGFIDLLDEVDYDGSVSTETIQEINEIDMHNIKTTVNATQVGDTYSRGTPFAMSLWAAPEGEPGNEEYSGLWSLGEYERTDDASYDRSNMYPLGYVGLWASCPAQDAVVSSYPKGMGLTFFMREYGVEDEETPEGLAPPRTKLPSATSNIYHFFNSDGTPARLDNSRWNHILFQFLPSPASNRSPKIRLWLNGVVKYGIHAFALTDTTGDFKKIGHSACPIGSTGGNVWGNSYGYTPTETFDHLNTYKLGKANFLDKEDISTRFSKAADLFEKATALSNAVEYDYFKGTLAQFSLWSGILSSKDIERIYNLGEPCNILEEALNKEIRGGYTDEHRRGLTLDPDYPYATTTDGRLCTSSDAEWGLTAPIITIDNTQTNTPTDVRKAMGYTTYETRERGAGLAAWHYLGIPYKVEVESTCEDWDDRFFDTYAHTDNIKFFDMVVDDHDGVGNNATPRLRLKVNAVKKLLPYRGFYPQDRTVQIASLFADKMVPNIYPNSTDQEHHILHHEQAVQAALQPFFAPGILYNSIKAGLAVDWPAFTNKSGMEPAFWGDSVTLPYPKDTKDGSTTAGLQGPAPTWYAKREDSFNSNEGLASHIGTSYPNTAYLTNSQPKFPSGEVDENTRSDLGYIIVDEPTTRIPFEGLLSLESTLATTEELEVDTPPIEGAFKHIDLEIDAWDAEGVIISGYQPVSQADGTNGLPQRDAEAMSAGGWKFQSWSVSIGDPDLEINDGADWDVEVDFRTAPKGMKVPIGTPGADSYSYNSIAEFDPDLLEGGTGHGVTTKSKLNEEIAVKLCRAINKRDDIHFVAIPGHCPTYRWGNSTTSINGRITFETESGLVTHGLSDDHIARLFPLAHPKVSGLDETKVRMPAANSAGNYEIPWAEQLGNDGSLWLRDKKGFPVVGRQAGGKWRIRLIYVGPLLPSVIDPKVGTLGAENAVDDDGFVQETNTYTKYEHQPSESEAIKGARVEEIDPATDVYWGTQTFETKEGGYELTWKELHVVNPNDIYDYQDGTDIADIIFEGGADPSEKLPDGWYTTNGIPKTFFDGGAWPLLDPAEYPDAKNMQMSDYPGISTIRQLGVITQSKWMPGYGWYGYANYSLDTELGVRLVDPTGTTVYGSFNGADGVSKISQWSSWYQDNPNWSSASGVPDWMALSSLSTNESMTVELSDGAKPKQGPMSLYGGIDIAQDTGIRVTPRPSQMFLMAPEYYTGSFSATAKTTECEEGDELKCYLYPYFEWNGAKGDPLYEMAMHNFLAEVPNFFLKRKGFVTFASKRENEFKTMVAGTTYYMDVAVYRKNISTVRSPYDGDSGDTFQGAYYGPSFQWKAKELYTSAKDWRKDPSQAPYAPPYLYGKSIARISFLCPETKKYSLDEIMSRAQSEPLSPEVLRKFEIAAGAEVASVYTDVTSLNSGGQLIEKSKADVINSPAWKARMPVSASINLFGKTRLKPVQYNVQLAPNFTDAVDVTAEQFVPMTATDPQNSEQDIWVISPKFECPILNYENTDSASAMQLVTPSMVFQNAVAEKTEKRSSTSLSVYNSAIIAQTQLISDNYLLAVTSLELANPGCYDSGTGVWAGYGRVPNPDEGVFLTIEDSFKQDDKTGETGSLIDVCGFQSQTARIGELANEKEISEAVVMIPFVDEPSTSGAQTTLVDNRNFFKINKDLFNLQKTNIEKGSPAVGVQEWKNVTHSIWETSISRMVRMMKKYNIPPRYDFLTYPLASGQDPFVMYIFEFNHMLDKEDLSNIWQGVSPKLATRAEYDTQELVHDLSPVDFFESQKLPSNIRWLTFKVKRKAKTNYYAATASDRDDHRFKFDFAVGEKAPEYSYNWPYDFFTMVELVQAEGGLDISEQPIGQGVNSNQGEFSTEERKEQVLAAHTEEHTSIADDLGVGPVKDSNVFGAD